MITSDTISCAIGDLDAVNGVLIGGRSHGADTTFVVQDPATGETIAEVADASVDQAVAAVDAAEQAFSSWSRTSPRERSEILRRAYDLMTAVTDQLVGVICAENGKAQQDARDEVTYAAEFFRWFSEEAVRTDGGYGSSPAGGTRTIVTSKPVGIAALVTPWNFPAAMATRKLAPALAAGCTAVLKPASETPLTALAITKILQAAGLPDGVVNVVPSTSSAAVVGAWLSDERIRKISFTGSTGVGRALLKQAADQVLNTSMELGGNAPFVVTADADVAAAVDGAMIAKFRGGGQACTAANRFYIHAAVVDEFTARFAARIETLRVGPAANPKTEIGPLINMKAAHNIQRLIDRAVEEGATVACRAEAPAGGSYLAPTLLTGVGPRDRILTEEIFGPVAPVVTWQNEAEMLDWVNATEYGLAAYVFAGSLQSALRIAESIDAGMIGINRGIVSDPSAPFGGTKQSGLGREGGREGLREFQEIQYFSVDFT